MLGLANLSNHTVGIIDSWIDVQYGEARAQYILTSYTAMCTFNVRKVFRSDVHHRLD